MALQDKSINCKDCGVDFTWTADEQAFYQEKGFSAPLRCKPCRVKARAVHGDRSSSPRESFPITCSECGAQDTVPFQPRGDKPVLCRNCFQKKKGR
jgi:CxxC-x17-CxxC domain-containing protein